jgi:hypothetical protein
MLYDGQHEGHAMFAGDLPSGLNFGDAIKTVEHKAHVLEHYPPRVSSLLGQRPAWARLALDERSFDVVFGGKSDGVSLVKLL